jgi:hypothetical protein
MRTRSQRLLPKASLVQDLQSETKQIQYDQDATLHLHVSHCDWITVHRFVLILQQLWLWQQSLISRQANSVDSQRACAGKSQL